MWFVCTACYDRGYRFKYFIIIKNRWKINWSKIIFWYKAGEEDQIACSAVFSWHVFPVIFYSSQIFLKKKIYKTESRKRRLTYNVSSYLCRIFSRTALVKTQRTVIHFLLNKTRKRLHGNSLFLKVVELKGEKEHFDIVPQKKVKTVFNNIISTKCLNVTLSNGSLNSTTIYDQFKPH